MSVSPQQQQQQPPLRRPSRFAATLFGAAHGSQQQADTPQRPTSAATVYSLNGGDSVGASRTTIAEESTGDIVLSGDSRGTLQERDELLLDRVKLLASCSFVLLHATVLVALDSIMMKRACSSLLGASFFVLAAALSLLPACALLAMAQPQSRSRRALIGICSLWGVVLLADAVWICLAFPSLNAACLGTALIGAVAIGLVCCPASLVGFVILHGWLAVCKPTS